MTLTIETRPQTVPAEPTTPMRLSEAIRLGCLVAPEQAFGFVFGRRGDAEDRTKACVVGTGALAMGIEPQDFEDRDPKGPCPASGCDAVSWSVMVHLNDDHHWSRERIASWLETLGL